MAEKLLLSFALKSVYKLRMLGVEKDGSIFLYGDNRSVIISTTNPRSTLRKKRNILEYYRIGKAIKAKVIDFWLITNITNFTEIITKALPPYKYHVLQS